MLKRGDGRDGPHFHREDAASYQTAIWTTSTLLFVNFSSSRKTSCCTRLGIRFGTRLGESGADAFTIMRLMGHSTVTVSQR
jgi:hypothetical protein